MYASSDFGDSLLMWFVHTNVLIFYRETLKHVRMKIRTAEQ